MFYCNITKVNDEERIVEGYASTESMDVQGEIVKIEAIKDALPDYMKFANIREMHQPSAVGKAVSADVDEKGLYLSVNVVDDSAWEKVKKGVYNGFSIGGKKITKIGDTITKLRLTEISLVDRPANPEAVFNLWKGDGMNEEQKEPEIQDEEIVKSDDSDMQKGLYDVARLAEIMSSLKWLQECISEESEYEKDNSPIPMELADILSSLSSTLKNLVAEETTEMMVEIGAEQAELEAEMALSDGAENDIEKAGASISSANKAKLESIVKMCKEMMGEMETTEKMEKSFGLDDLQKAFEVQASEMAKMADRIKELEAMPVPSKLETVIIAKGEEDSNLIDMDKLSATDLIKMAHQGKL